MAWDTLGKRKLDKQPAQPFRILADVGIDLAVAALDIRVGHRCSAGEPDGTVARREAVAEQIFLRQFFARRKQMLGRRVGGEPVFYGVRWSIAGRWISGSWR